MSCKQCITDNAKAFYVDFCRVMNPEKCHIIDMIDIIVCISIMLQMRYLWSLVKVTHC